MSSQEAPLYLAPFPGNILDGTATLMQQHIDQVGRLDDSVLTVFQDGVRYVTLFFTIDKPKHEAAVVSSKAA